MTNLPLCASRLVTDLWGEAFVAKTFLARQAKSPGSSSQLME